MNTTPIIVTKVFCLVALLCLLAAHLQAQCPLPTPTIRISQVGLPNSVAHGSFCPGERVQLNAQLTQNIADARFQWQRDGNNIAGATQSTYVTNQNGIYTVTIETPTCATTARSTPITIKVEDCTPSGRVRIKGGSLEEDINDLYNLRYAFIRLTLYTHPNDRNQFPNTITAYIYRKRDSAPIRTVLMQRRSQIERLLTFNPACGNDLIPINDIYYFYYLPYDPVTFNDPDGYYITSAPVCCREPSANLEGETPIVFRLEFAPHNRYSLTQPRTTLTTEFYLPSRLETCAGQNTTFPNAIEPSANVKNARYSFAEAFTSLPTAPRHQPVALKAGFTTQNFVGNTNNSITINPQTGTISGIFEKPGQYTYVVKAELLQDNEKVGEIYREIRIEVKNCDNTKPSLFASAEGKPSVQTAPQLCAGSRLQLNATTVSTGGKLQWQRDGNPIAGATNTTLVVQEAGEYTLTVIKDNACPALVISNTIEVTTNTPTVNATLSDGGPCPDQPQQLKATVPTTVKVQTYTWYRNNIVIPSANDSIYVTNLTGEYRIEIMDILGCKASSSAVNLLPKTPITVSISSGNRPGAKLCPTAANFYRAFASVSVQSYQWYRNDTLISGAISSTFTPTQIGKYTVKITSSDGCTATSPTVELPQLGGVPSYSAVGDKKTFCPGGSVKLTTTLDPIFTYQWLRDGQTIMGATSVDYTASATGQYSVVLRDSAGCTVTSSPWILSQLTPPSVLVSGNKQFCHTDSAALKAESASAVKYQWILNSSFIDMASASILITRIQGTYQVQVTDTSGCTSVSSPWVLTTNNLPEVRIRGVNQICQNTATVFNAEASSAIKYQWLFNSVRIDTATTATLKAQNAGNYEVQVTDVNGCTAVSSPQPLVVNPLPTVQISGKTQVCRTSTTQLLAQSNGLVQYQWLFNNTPIDTAQSATLYVQNAGIYQVQVTDNKGCTLLSPPWTLTVNIPSPLQISGNNQVCRDASTILKAEPSHLSNYRWLYNGTLIDTSTVLNAQKEGIYQVQATDENGCRAMSEEWFLKTINQIAVDFELPDSVCINASTIPLQGSPLGGIFSGSGITNNQFDPAKAGKGTHSVTYSLMGPTACQSATLQKQITVKSLPLFDLGSDITINQGTSVTLNNPIGTGYTYLWEPSIGLNDSNIPNPIAEPVQTTVYSLTVKDQFGCEATDSITVQVGKRLYIPDVFTPNGDGENDFWKLIGYEAYPDIEVTVYNRWGNAVFYSKGYQQPFTGVNSSNQLLPTGQYAYVISYDGHKQWGALLLLR